MSLYSMLIHQILVISNLKIYNLIYKNTLNNEKIKMLHNEKTTKNLKLKPAV